MMRPPKERTHVEFAEQEIVLPPVGPFKNTRFRFDRQPFTRLWLAEYDRIDPETGFPYWRRRFSIGPRQSSKTLLGSCEPICYHLFEVGESVIYGVLSLDMAGDKWNDDILPVVMKTRYAQYLPSKGAGSRGGRVSTIHFLNGATLRFQTVGSSTGRRGPTARILIVTELNEWGEESSSTSDPSSLSELEGCTQAFGERAIIYGEGTIGTKDEPAWHFYSNGSATRIFTPCPHCGKRSCMERESLVGWDCDNPEDARKNVKWICPACGEPINERQRIEANRHSVLVHKGQDIDEDGNVCGPMPKTRDLGFRWSAFHNLLVPTTTLAEREWRAKNAANEEEAEKAIRQTVWCIPYEPHLIDDARLDARTVMQRIEPFAHRDIPQDTELLTLGVDIHDWWCYYILLAFRKNKQIHIPDYGVMPVHSDQAKPQIAVLHALYQIRDIVTAGWPQVGSSQRATTDMAWLDAGHFPAIVHQFCKDVGTYPSGKWMATIGRGEAQVRKQKYNAPKRTSNEIRRIGEGWFISKTTEHKSHQVTIDADYSKISFQKSLKIPIADKDGKPTPGAVTLFKPTETAKSANFHMKITKHFASEQIVQRLVEGKGLVTEWEQHGENHWLDAAAMAYMAGTYLGFRLTHDVEATPTMTVQSWVAQQRQR